MHCKYTN
ncbi:hypothetical protein CP061683_0990A, partial [Chlamydia psittaci 06-1683]